MLTVLSLVLPLVGVLMGFGLSVGWDYWKTSRAQQAELLRAAQSVDHETQNNLAVISNDLFSLTKDDAEADKNGELVTPPVMPLLTSAVETAFRTGSFDVYSRDLSIGVGDIYTTNYLINKRIEGRDFYRFTNQAMDNYSRRRKMLNTELEGILREQEGRLNSLHQALMKIMYRDASH
jgi:hypothetical protein